MATPNNKYAHNSYLMGCVSFLVILTKNITIRVAKMHASCSVGRCTLAIFDTPQSKGIGRNWICMVGLVEILYRLDKSNTLIQ